jgi:hypothetical protein
MLLALASEVFLGSESLWTREHILLSQILGFLFVAFYDSQGHGGGIRPRLHTCRDKFAESESELHCEGRSVSLSVLVSSLVWGS